MHKKGLETYNEIFIVHLLDSIREYGSTVYVGMA